MASFLALHLHSLGLSRENTFAILSKLLPFILHRIPMKTPFLSLFLAAFLCLQSPALPPTVALANNAEAIDRLIQRAEQRRIAIAKTMEQSTVFIYSRDDDGVSMGTGFVVADGYVLSNGHVVEGGSNFYIGGKDFRPVRAEVIEWIDDDISDFALLKFNPPIQLPILSFNLNVQRTDRVSAWGFPYLVTQFDQGMEDIESGENSNIPPVVYSEGSVSAFLQQSNGRKSIAHTAPMSGGNSGGPLINSRGEVVGINTWVATDDDRVATVHASLMAGDAVNFLRSLGIDPHIADGSPTTYTSQNPTPATPRNNKQDEENNGQGGSLAGLFGAVIDGVNDSQKSPDTHNNDANLRDTHGLKDDAKELHPEALKGDAAAQAYLGLSYWLGEEAPEDTHKAVAWLRKAVAQNNSDAQHILGLIYLVEPDYKNVQQGLSLLKTAAKSNDKAASSLAYFLMFGEVNGIERDPKASFAAAQKGARSQETGAYALLALFYFSGEGVVDADPKRALEYVQKSKDEALSQAVLSWMHHQGKGAAEDDDKAFTYAKKAAEADDYLGQGLLSYYYYSGLGTKTDYKKALQYAEAASENFNELGYYVLASMYANGEGVQKDIIKAWAYFDMAARKDITSADEQRDDLAKNMSKQDLSAAKDLVRSWHEQNGLPFK